MLNWIENILIKGDSDFYPSPKSVLPFLSLKVTSCIVVTVLFISTIWEPGYIYKCSLAKVMYTWPENLISGGTWTSFSSYLVTYQVCCNFFPVLLGKKRASNLKVDTFFTRNIKVFFCCCCFLLRIYTYLGNKRHFS